MNNLAEEGLIVAAGPVAGTESDQIRVLLIADANNEAEITERLATDPWECGSDQDHVHRVVDASRR